MAEKVDAFSGRFQHQKQLPDHPACAYLIDLLQDLRKNKPTQGVDAFGV